MNTARESVNVRSRVVHIHAKVKSQAMRRSRMDSAHAGASTMETCSSLAGAQDPIAYPRVAGDGLRAGSLSKRVANY